jgi:fructokinase
MHQTQILPLIRKKFAAHMNGYIRTREIEDLDSFIVCQSLDDKQGIMGAVKLAMMETGH